MAPVLEKRSVKNKMWRSKTLAKGGILEAFQNRESLWSSKSERRKERG